MHFVELVNDLLTKNGLSVETTHSGVCLNIWIRPPTPDSHYIWFKIKFNPTPAYPFNPAFKSLIGIFLGFDKWDTS